MPYSAAAYKLGKGTTITIGSDVVTNARVISMPTVEHAAVDIPHLGGVDCAVGDATGYGEIAVELPIAQAITLTRGTSYNITVTDAASNTLINAKAATLRAVSHGTIDPANQMVATYTFKFTAAPF